MKAFHTIIIVAAFCFFEENLYSQARSSIAVGAGITQPLQKGYATGSSWILQSSIRLSSKFALLPEMGIEKIRSNKNGMYNGYYFVGSGRSVDLFLLNLSTRYYFTHTIFITAGPSLYVGGEDAGSSGVGGTVALGYDLQADPHNNFELTLHCDVLPVYKQTVTVAGLRIAYKFNFRKKPAL